MLPCPVGKYILAASYADQFGHPADAADHRLIPLLEIDFKTFVTASCSCDIAQPSFIASCEIVRTAAHTNQGPNRPDHGENAGNVAMIEGVHRDTGADELGHDIGLQVREGEDEIRRESKNLRNIRRGES